MLSFELRFRQEQCPVGEWTYDMRADLKSQVKPEFLPAVEALLDEVFPHMHHSQGTNEFRMVRLTTVWKMTFLPIDPPNQPDSILYAKF